MWRPCDRLLFDGALVQYWTTTHPLTSEWHARVSVYQRSKCGQSPGRQTHLGILRSKNNIFHDIKYTQNLIYWKKWQRRKPDKKCTCLSIVLDYNYCSRKKLWLSSMEFLTLNPLCTYPLSKGTYVRSTKGIQRIRGFLNYMRYINSRFIYLLTYLLTTHGYQ